MASVLHEDHHQVVVSSATLFRPLVCQLPQTYRDEYELQEYAAKSKEIRLKGLANDPDSFSSSFEMEIHQPIGFWTGRLLNPEARTFVVCLPNSYNSLSEANPGPLQATWVGTLVLLGPRTIDLSSFMDGMTWKRFTDGSPKPPQAPLEGATLMYYIAAVYVDSDFRRRGLARKISIDTIKAVKDEVNEKRAARAVIMIGAEHNNTSAIMLYESLGWKRVAIDRFIAKDGRNITGIQLRLDIDGGEST